MLERRKPIWVKEAIDYVMQLKKHGDTEIVSIDDCDGRFLAEPLVADHDVPPFDRSPYDGFALRAIDTKKASGKTPLTFKVIDEIGAGQVSPFEVGCMEAIRIMTGAQIPQGADCVIMLELTQEEQRSEGTFIAIKRSLNKGDNISYQGEDTKKGNLLINKGVAINPGIKALLATFGYSNVKVSKRPVIGIIATGSELLNPDENLVPGKIRNSNGYMIESQILRAGAKFKRYGSISDNLDSLFETIMIALNECDILITTGGVSVGDFDYLPEIYRKLGANLLFNKIAMRPGSVTSCAEKDGKFLFGLSGNPSACYIGFELFVRPYIRYWLRSEQPFLRFIRGTLKKDFLKANPFSRFVRGKIVYENGMVFAEPVGLDKSGVVTSLAWADCLIILPGGTRGYKKGDQVELLILDDQLGCDKPWVEAKFSK
ncbi:gephyrin-like molybdotransferase Glp [Lederbergia wuyishanensis]|uniref:Molybdopterin molybdenumtransferase n=1 Tax=Lederbergia wuyishanensis TaxID=1347903 RepID=A0ABU0D0L1_9BACI|nr:gephyrin-like molybdotransferase Glp [Lederbergia wuyishanensis]MCJ8006566.1 molybdopterin molybdotransferase MoeA [Lederbergia wuyishanensis]MDQ0341947.1 molybdopterin molybdotransferase [Lederbergia wuyishanensis]